uniref:C2H2-type domain-containing protein n=1 Tax=Brassica campestris TaxID=3711 RepID=M4E372_BRACM
MSSSYSQSIPLIATGANNFNQKEMEMTMTQKRNTFVSPSLRKQRNQPGNRNPDAEVIALSPKTIMATNRFLCEVCNRGFNREQNLQLHGRVHNLPWKPKQKSEKEARRKVFICPEPTCVHHDPSHALRDFTGIKKHYYRKHGEKQWKCDKCPKSYALQSDWKTHSKICGIKVHRCDCGTTFSRRENYNAHKALCDALNQESGRNPTGSITNMAAAAGGSDGRQDFYGGAASALGRLQDFYACAASALGRQDFYGGAASALGRHGFYRGAASALSHNQFGNNSNTGYNLNRSSSNKFEGFVPHPTNPNPGPTNFPMQCPSNQASLAHNDQSLRSQHDLISLGARINNNNNNTNHGYFQNNTKTSNQTLFAHGADINDPSVWQRGLTPSSSSGVVVNGFGDNDKGNLQGRMNSLAMTTNQQGWSASNIFGPHFGNNLSMGGSDVLTLGVNGGSVSKGRGDRNPAPLDTQMKFAYPNRPFGNP